MERSCEKLIRIRSEDSAYVYAILEACEGVASFSTCPHQQGDRHRDLEIRYHSSQSREVDEILEALRQDLEDPAQPKGPGYLLQMRSGS